MSSVLLDTHAVLWLDSGAPMREAARDAIESAATGASVFVSAVSAWEVGLLVRKRRLILDTDPSAWLDRLLASPGIRLVPLQGAAAIRSSSLPEPFHGDPADRLLVATARDLAVPLVTRDERILHYAALGHVRALAC